MKQIPSKVFRLYQEDFLPGNHGAGIIYQKINEIIDYLTPEEPNDDFISGYNEGLNKGLLLLTEKQIQISVEQGRKEMKEKVEKCIEKWTCGTDYYAFDLFRDLRNL